MTGKRQPIIVLLGVHRSGTSLTMSVLNALGIQCGDRLIPAARGNETGFWEHADIVATHEQLLAEFNRVWHGRKTAAVARVCSAMRRSAVANSTAQNRIIARAYEGLSAMARDEQPRESFRRLRRDFQDIQQLFEPWRRDTRHVLLDWATRFVVRRRMVLTTDSVSKSAA